MKNLRPLLALCVLSSAAIFLLAGCLTTKPSDSMTVTNTNVNAIIDAANTVFPQYGYSVGPVNYPNSISFDRPAGTFGKMMYGSYGVTTTVRVKLVMTQLGTSNNYALSTKVTRVSDAGEAGFEDSQKMLGMWSAQFKPLLRQVIAQANGAGPM